MEAPKYIYLATTTREWNNVGFAGIACTTEDDIINPVKYIRADLAELTWKNIAKIITIYEEELSVGNISKYGDSSDMRTFSEHILRKYNEIR